MPKPSRGDKAPADAAREKTFQVIAEGLKPSPAYLLVFAIGTIGVALLGANAFFKPTDLQMKLSFGAFLVFVVLGLIVIIVKERGERESTRSAEAKEAFTRFREQITGDWWEQITLVRRPDGSEEPSSEMSSLSHVTIMPDDMTGHITMRAIGYNRQGDEAADWDSDVALIKGDKVFYFWNGRHTSKDNTGEEREGFGQFTFVGDFAKGKFVDLDVGLRDLPSAETKIVELVRCSADEVAVLRSHDGVKIRKLVGSKLSKGKVASTGAT